MDLTTLDGWRTLTLGSAALGQTCFVILYLTFPWWRSFLGRSLFYKAIILAVLTDMAWAARYFEFARNDVLFVVLYGALAGGIWWQFSSFLRVKIRAKHSRAQGGPESRSGGLA